jgi:hypothetical protein
MEELLEELEVAIAERWGSHITPSIRLTVSFVPPLPPIIHVADV